jgi:hypothetical protein
MYWYNIWLPLSSSFKWVLCHFLSVLDTILFLFCYNAAWLWIIYDLFKCYYVYVVQLICMKFCFWNDIILLHTFFWLNGTQTKGRWEVGLSLYYCFSHNLFPLMYKTSSLHFFLHVLLYDSQIKVRFSYPPSLTQWWWSYVPIHIRSSWYVASSML